MMGLTIKGDTFKFKDAYKTVSLIFEKDEVSDIIKALDDYSSIPEYLGLSNEDDIGVKYITETKSHKLYLGYLNGYLVFRLEGETNHSFMVHQQGIYNLSVESLCQMAKTYILTNYVRQCSLC